MKKYIGYTCVLFLLGCATAKPIETGFLGDYEKFRPSDKIEGLLVEKHPTKTIGDYSKFIVDRIEIRLTEKSKGGKLNREQVQKMAEKLHDEIVTGLNEKYEVVTKPGEGVLEIRSALTDIYPNKIYLNLHWSTTMSKHGIGGAAIEAEFIDTVTKERILGVVDARQGKPLKYSKGLTRWGHTQEVFDGWRDLLLQTLNDLHAQKAATEHPKAE
jgi:hypothetical protein